MRSKFQISGFGFKVGTAEVEASNRSDAPSILNPKSGFTLLEIIIVITILSVLTAAAVPMVRTSVKRQREEDLRVALRDIRQAIDRYKAFGEQFPNAIPIKWRTPSGYPKELKLLSEGFEPANVVTGSKKRFLRKLPDDPMTGKPDWGVRSYTDDFDSTSTNGEDVFDVYSKSDGVPLNGIGKYKDW
ncbi:MAG TPA: type II secretion system protein [Blastocatellia bacterium]|jgi:general secretion pathway protein G|nr:type II secretion system protein [Blastocatellia bacterium]